MSSLPEATTTTIKERLLADIQAYSDHRGRCKLTPEELARRVGLNGHDLAKNLTQLFKEGWLHDPWIGPTRLGRIRLKADRNAEALAALKPSVTSRRDDILNWIKLQPGGALGAWVDLPEGWATVAAALHVPEDKVKSTEVTASKLVADGVLEARRERRRVMAVRLPLANWPLRVAGNGTNGSGAAAVKVAAAERVTMPQTPALDQYVAARRMARLAPERNPYLVVTFEPDSLGEEAEALREALRRALGIT